MQRNTTKRLGNGVENLEDRRLMTGDIRAGLETEMVERPPTAFAQHSVVSAAETQALVQLRQVECD